jgi:hypothetical protein
MTPHQPLGITERQYPYVARLDLSGPHAPSPLRESSREVWGYGSRSRQPGPGCAPPGAGWVIDCANCEAAFATTPFDATAFCSARCRAIARVVRYGRRQIIRFGPTSGWTDEVLRQLVERVPDGIPLAEIGRRLDAQTPTRDCDDEHWNETFQHWVAVARRATQLPVDADR